MGDLSDVDKLQAAWDACDTLPPIVFTEKEAAALAEPFKRLPNPVADDWALAASINNCDAVMKVYAAPEWDELSDDGKAWVVALVQEMRRRVQHTGFPKVVPA